MQKYATVICCVKMLNLPWMEEKSMFWSFSRTRGEGVENTRIVLPGFTRGGGEDNKSQNVLINPLNQTNQITLNHWKSLWEMEGKNVKKWHFTFSLMAYPTSKSIATVALSSSSSSSSLP